MKAQIGIIGFGKFGRLMAEHLKKKASIVVTDIHNKSKEARNIGIKFVSLDEAVKSKVIILATPMENLVQTLHIIKDKLIPRTLVLDVCSLKIFSCEAMAKILPKNVEVIGTHPLFGPQSASSGIGGLKIVLCNVTSKRKTFNRVKNFCNSLGLKVLITTPEEHDRQMAASQALTHFIGKAINNSGTKRVELSTKTFDMLMNVADIIKNNTPALFKNMQNMNPFAKDVRERFIKELNEIEEELK